MFISSRFQFKSLLDKSGETPRPVDILQRKGQQETNPSFTTPFYKPVADVTSMQLITKTHLLLYSDEGAD